MEFNENRPIWLQIYEMICNEIASGRWPEEQHIPSVRELSVQLQVNPRTAIRAYERLIQEEVLQVRRGFGYYVQKGARLRTLDMLRKEFFHTTLHAVFDRMDELGIGIDSIRRMHELHQKRKNHENKQ